MPSLFTIFRAKQTWSLTYKCLLCAGINPATSDPRNRSSNIIFFTSLYNNFDYNFLAYLKTSFIVSLPCDLVWIYVVSPTIHMSLFLSDTEVKENSFLPTCSLKELGLQLPDLVPCQLQGEDFGTVEGSWHSQ